MKSLFGAGQDRKCHEGFRDRATGEPPRADGIFRHAIETGRTRLLITGAVIALAFTTVGLRLVDVSALNSPSEPEVAHAATASDEPTVRASIVDRNGVIVATSLSTVSLSANPRQMMDPQEAAAKLAAVLPDVNRADLARRFSSNARFVWVHRSLTPQLQYEVNKLGIPGLEFHKAETRVYPQGHLLSHILGFTDIDNNGLAGLEKSYDDVLRKTSDPLQLSVDVRVQYIVREELAHAIKEFSAIGGTGIVMDVRDGEVLSMVSLPDFDPNHAGDYPATDRFNRATLGVYELGSTFKIFNTALALESGVAKMADRFDATKPIHISRFTISDYHAKNRWLSVPEIFIYSSNIGSAKMALEFGPATQESFMKKIGFLDPEPIEIPEAGKPLYPDVWRPINTMTIAFGHGLSVSPLHLATGVSAIVNGGILHTPTLLKVENDKRPGERVISAHTSDLMRRIMRLNNVAGSGKEAEVPGYLVGGKTGTAEKLGASGNYKRKALISSYVAAFPMNDPRYVVYIVLDEPQGTKKTFGYATGGWVAAPVVSKVIERAAPILGVEPVDKDSPQVRQAVALDLPQPEGKRLASFEQ